MSARGARGSRERECPRARVRELMPCALTHLDLVDRRVKPILCVALLEVANAPVRHAPRLNEPCLAQVLHRLDHLDAACGVRARPRRPGSAGVETGRARVRVCLVAPRVVDEEQVHIAHLQRLQHECLQLAAARKGSGSGGSVSGAPQQPRAVGRTARTRSCQGEWIPRSAWT